MTSAYYKLPGVDKRTYLINGKNVIMAGDRGRSIGVVDLTLAVTGEDTLEIVERKSDIRFVKILRKKNQSLIYLVNGRKIHQT